MTRDAPPSFADSWSSRAAQHGGRDYCGDLRELVSADCSGARVNYIEERDNHSGGREDFSRGRDYYGGGRGSYGSNGYGGGSVYSGGGRDDFYRTESGVDYINEGGSSVAVSRGGFTFRRPLVPEVGDLKKKLEETDKEKKKLEDELRSHKIMNAENIQKIKLSEVDLEIEKRKRKASEISFNEIEKNCEERKKLLDELISLKKKNAEKVLKI